MPFYPKYARVPSEKQTARLFLRSLKESDAKFDYEALMASKEQLRRWSGTSWPADEFTLSENQQDLKRHELEHEAREAFTFTVLNLDKTLCLGCVYIEPIPHKVKVCSEAKQSANVAFWVRSSELNNDLDKHLFVTLREWLANDWAFDCLVFMVNQQNARQSELLQSAGLKRSAFSLSDGRACWLFKLPHLKAHEQFPDKFC